MSIDLAAFGHRSARAVIAAWLIAVQLVLTASVGAVVCGSGSAGEPLGSMRPPSAPISSDGNYVRRAASAADALAAALGGIELEAAIVDTRTGERALVGGTTAPMLSASLSKLIVAVDIIDRRRGGGLLVVVDDLRLVEQALGPSDDRAMDELWTRFDGSNAVGRVSARLGLSGTTAPADPYDWGETTVTAADITQLYRHVLDMPRSDRDLILGALAAAPPVAQDGFVQDFGLLALAFPGMAIAKQGWMCCWGETGYLHSAGIVGDGRFVVVLLSRQQLQQDWQPLRDRLTAIAGAINDVLAAARDTRP